MPKIKCLASGSSANCYLLFADSGKCLILEAGVKFNVLSEHIPTFRSVVGCLITHGTHDIDKVDENGEKGKLYHTDHSLIAKVLQDEKYIKIYGTHNLQPNKYHSIGEFEVLPIAVNHNCPCFAYLMKVDNKILYFGTDLQQHLVQTKQQISVAMVEFNYSTAIIEQRQEKCRQLAEKIEKLKVQLSTVDTTSDLIPTIENEIRELETELSNSRIKENFLSHCSNETAMAWLNGLEKKPHIVVPIHISKNNNDEQIICDLLKDYDFRIAKKGVEIEI